MELRKNFWIVAAVFLAFNAFASDFVPGESIVKFKSRTFVEQKRFFEIHFHEVGVLSAEPLQGADELILVQFDPSLDTEEVSKRFSEHPEIE